MSRLYMLAAAALTLSTTAHGQSQRIPQIAVEGVGEVSTTPDVADVDYEIRGEGSTSDQALTEMVDKSRRIENAILSIDPMARPVISDFKVITVRNPKCEEDEDEGQVRLSTGECAIVGYRATQEALASTTAVSQVGTMVGLMAREGASNPRVRNFRLRDEKAARRAAIAAALVDALEKAEAVAQASKSRLGQLLSVDVDGARADAAIIVTGTILRRSGNITASPVQVTLTPKSIETRSRVTAIYALNAN